MLTVRKQFETWMRKHHPKLPSLEHYEEGYFDDQTQLAWEAWQVAWAKAYQSGFRSGKYRVVFQKRLSGKRSGLKHEG